MYGFQVNPQPDFVSIIVALAPAPAPPSWKWPGLTQPTITYDGNTIDFPLSVSCEIDFLTDTRLNIGLDKSLEFIDKGYPKLMKVKIGPHYDATFETALETFFANWGGKRKWFAIVTGQDTRNDGNWLLKMNTLKPTILDNGLRTYELILWRPFD